MRAALAKLAYCGLLVAIGVWATPVRGDGGDAGDDDALRDVDTLPAPQADDHTFVVASGAGLDTGCTYRSGGPLVINIPVTRYLGPTKDDGTLVNAPDLVQQGLLSAYAELTLAAYDVDYDCESYWEPPCERDRVTFNGHTVKDLNPANSEYLHGADEIWAKNTFQIPIENVKFPSARGTNGNTPTAANNELRIDIDTASPPGVANQYWCTAIDWAALKIGCMSPIILIHGIHSDGGFFMRQGFTGGLDSQFLLWDNSITFCPRDQSDRCRVNADRLSNLIPPIVASYGVDSIHLVAHSKGGLDVRSYLQYCQSRHDQQFRVLSFTTLSTPHNGSVLADIGETYRIEYQRASVDMSAYPGMAHALV